jgi:hypothetical protein
MEQGDFLEKDDVLYLVISHSCDVARRKELEPFMK